MITHHKTLEEINLSYCNLSSKELISIFNAIKHNSSLKRLKNEL